LIVGQFIHIKLNTPPVLKKDWLWMRKNKLRKYAFPKFINSYFLKK
jgi:hypothetical protein